MTSISSWAASSNRAITTRSCTSTRSPFIFGTRCYNAGWLKSGMNLNMPKYSISSITVIGAISEKRVLVHFQIFDSTSNFSKFQAFLQVLKAKGRGAGSCWCLTISGSTTQGYLVRITTMTLRGFLTAILLRVTHSANLAPPQVV